MGTGVAVADGVIEEHLRSVGIDEQLNGFRYLADVIALCMENPNNTLGQAHAVVADSFEVSPENVSVSIHYCLKHSGRSYKEREFVRHAARILSSRRASDE